MDRDAYAAGTESAVVRLHLHRGPGILYGILAVVVLTGVAAGVASYASDGRTGMALVTAVVGLGAIGVLAFLSFAVLAPALTASATGIAGRLASGRKVNADWSEVAIDVEEEASPGQLRVDLGGDSLTVTLQSWLGFRDFVILVASTSAATAQLTPAARHEVVRLLQIDGPASNG